MNDDELKTAIRTLLEEAVAGTVTLTEGRRMAIELAMKHLGMLNQKERSELPKDVETIEGFLESFKNKQSRHTLHNTTNQDPASVEKFLREKSGMALPKEHAHASMRPKFKRSVKRGP